MARQETAYDRVENGIQTALMADGTPFKRVETYGSHLSDAELVEQLASLIRVAPAAIVCYGGGTTNEGHAGDLTEQAVYNVFVVSPAASREAATQGDAARVGVYVLLDWCRSQLHNVPDIDGINNPLLWRGNRRVGLPGHLLHVAAYVAEFRGDLSFPDGPT